MYPPVSSSSATRPRARFTATTRPDGRSLMHPSQGSRLSAPLPLRRLALEELAGIAGERFAELVERLEGHLACPVLLDRIHRDEANAGPSRELGLTERALFEDLIEPESNGHAWGSEHGDSVTPTGDVCKLL